MAPYRGIKPFRYADDTIFFGRDDESEHLASLVMVYRGVFLYGATGAGKSSLINAGLIPAVALHGLRPERIRLRPERGQEIVVERIEIDDLTGRLLPSIFVDAPDEASRTALSLRAFDARLRGGRGETRPLLIFDQFEEILTLFDERGAAELRAEIIATLVRLLREPIPIKFVFVFREEYLARITELLASCPELVDQSLRLAPPRPEVLPQIIGGPFERFPGHYPREFSAGLAQRLQGAFVERSGPDELSLSVVETVCLRLWESDDPDALLRERGVQGILEDYLGATLERMPPNEKAAAIALLSEMITSAGTRAVVSHEELMQRVAPKRAHARRIHEQALQQLVDESRLVRRESRRDSFLYELTSEFLVPWISHRRAELERQRRAARERRIMAIAASIVAVALVIGGLGVWALIEKRNLDRKTAEAKYLGLTGAAASELSARPDVSMLLLLAAHQTRSGAGAENSLLATFETAQRDGVVGILHGPTDAVESLAFDSTGHMLASASADGTVRFWSTEQHRQLGRSLAQGGPVTSVAVNGSGTMVASGGFGQIRLWNAHSGRLRETLAADSGGVSAAAGEAARDSGGAVAALAFRPRHDEILASGGLSGSLRLWNLDTGRVSSQLLPGDIRGVAFSPDGLTLAVSGTFGVALFDAVTAQPLGPPGRVGKFSNPQYAVAFSRDGRMLATGGDGRITVWARSPLRSIGSIPAGAGIVHSVAFAPSGRLVSGDGDGTVRLWNVLTRQQVGTPLSGHIGAVESIAVARSGMIASAGADATIRLWSIPAARSRASANAGNTRTLAVHQGLVNSIALSADGRTIVSADFHGVIDVSGVNGHLRFRRREPAPVESVALSPDGSTIAAGERDGGIALWQPGTARYVVLRNHDHAPVYSVAFDPRNGEVLASGGQDRLVHLWDLSHQPAIDHPLTGHTGPVYSVAFSLSGQLLASGGDDRTVRLWNVATMRAVGAPMIHPNAVFSVAFSPDAGRLATGGADGTLRLWKVASQHEIGQPLRGHTSFVRSVAFSRDGRVLASGSSDSTIRLWDATNASQLGAALTGSDGSVEAVAFTRQGTLVSSGGDGVVRFWGSVATPPFGHLEQLVCQFLGGGLSRGEWSLYAPNVPFQATCSGGPSTGG